jgi:hypothetical protein
MSVTSKLKRGVDLPVWEWLRALPVNTASPSTFTAGGSPDGRYLYYFPSTTNVPFRYDTWTDGWTALTNPPQSQSTVASSKYNAYHGYQGRAISAGPGANTMQCAVPRGNKCVGKKIKILYGTGAGQERTITAVSNSIIHDTLTVTSASQISIVDSNKSYTRNQYRDYAIRIIGNTATDSRKILFNTNNTIGFANNSFSAVGVPWAYSALPANTNATAGVQTIAQIESYNITVDSNWEIAPDSTSVFVIQSGLIWNINLAVGRFAFEYYDILNDAWYQTTSVSTGFLPGNVSTDIAIETISEYGVGVLRTGTIGSATSKTAVIDGDALATNQYANYIIRITGGTGFGQDRLIASCTGNTINTARAWDITPDNSSTFNIVADNDKIYMQGSAISAMMEYDCVHDAWSDRRILESGTPSNLCAIWKGYKRPIGLSSITRSGTTATATTVIANHGLKVGDIISIQGATDALYNVVNVAITAVADQTFNYTMTGTPGANAVATASQSATQLVDPSKNWTTNELVGKVVTFTTTAYSATGGFQQTYLHRVITANTAKTITFDSTTAPTAGSTMYYISDMRNHGGILATRGVTAGTTTSNIVTTETAMPVNIYAGRRVIITDGGNWGEASISSNTATTLVLSAVLAFTPTSSAFITILGNAPTGAGCTLDHMYNTSTQQKGRYIFSLRGANTNVMQLYDITTNTWEVVNQMPNAEIFTAGSMAVYDGDDRVYIQRDSTGRIFYYDLTDNNLYSYTTTPFAMSTAMIGNKMSIIKTQDGLKFLYIPRHNANEFWRILLWV